MINPAIELSLANHIGLNIEDSTQNLLAIKEALAGIENVEDFREFVIENKNRYESMRYFKPTEKLLELKKIYLDEQLNKKIPKELAEKFAQLSKKVKIVRHFVSCMLEQGREVTLANLINANTKKRVFSKKEIRALADIAGKGGINTILHYSYNDELEDKIEEFFKQKLIKKLNNKTKTAQISFKNENRYKYIPNTSKMQEMANIANKF